MKEISWFVMFSLFSTLGYSAEVTTDCPAMNESRSKIVKTEMKKKVKASVTKL